ncbi:MAG: bifunctional folylpolyglutamate synthase/dihydrofolate synthase [Chloroflexi bacterium]|nr:MAG: bifunctional folylpolyglutamate synthase/dihydrofolate synthase [Chloroflexota bacterium]
MINNMLQTHPQNLPNLSGVIDEYHRQHNWLLSLIRDPTGARDFEEKSPEVRLQQYRTQLARTADFLEFAGNPHTRYKSIHVAGTSGKGSVVAMMAAVLQQCRQRTGFHISPYLQICNEKLIVDGQMIPPSEFSALIEQFKGLYHNWLAADRAFNDLRYGEAWVILTYLWLANRNVDWAVIETGLGGRYDPTNVLPSNLAVITNVNFDHVKSLGPDLLNIARHKAGIIKPDGLVVTSETNPDVLAVIEAEAAQKNATLFRLNHEFSYSVEQTGANQTILSVQAPGHHYRHIRLNIPGQFQHANAALAVAGLDVLAQRESLPNLAQGIQRGLAAVEFPGRMELIQQEPPVILDGAHNPHKMAALVRSVRALYPHRRITALFGMIRVKNARAVLEVLAPEVSRFVVSAPRVYGKPALPPEDMAHIIEELSPNTELRVVDGVQNAVRAALQTVAPDELLLITGSLYLVGEARELWFPQDEILRQLEMTQI